MESASAPASPMSDDADWSGEANWMSLANIRSLGVRSVQLWCSCNHWAVVNVDQLGDTVKVPNVRLIFRCSECGSAQHHLGRTGWNETRVQPSWRYAGRSVRGRRAGVHGAILRLNHGTCEIGVRVCAFGITPITA